MRLKSHTLEQALEQGRLPRDRYCYFWIDWSVKDLQSHYLHRFPKGFVQVFRKLLPRQAQ